MPAVGTAFIQAWAEATGSFIENFSFSLENLPGLDTSGVIAMNGWQISSTRARNPVRPRPGASSSDGRPMPVTRRQTRCSGVHSSPPGYSAWTRGRPASSRPESGPSPRSSGNEPPRRNPGSVSPTERREDRGPARPGGSDPPRPPGAALRRPGSNPDRQRPRVYRPAGGEPTARTPCRAPRPAPGRPLPRVRPAAGGRRSRRPRPRKPAARACRSTEPETPAQVT